VLDKKAIKNMLLCGFSFSTKEGRKKMILEKTELQIIEEFENNHKIKEVVERLGGQLKGNALECILHTKNDSKGTNASISEGRNIYSCWTKGCGVGLTPWYLVAKFYGLSKFPDIAEKVNVLFGTNIPILRVGQKGSSRNTEPTENMDKVLHIKKYLSECSSTIKDILKEEKRLLLNANTGVGKTYAITNMLKNADTDYVFFLAPTRAIAEQVAKDYKYELFYGDMEYLPTNAKNIVLTYKKVTRLQQIIDEDIKLSCSMGEIPKNYTVVVDEVHQLISDREMLGIRLSKTMEEFILDSDQSVLMSANTKGAYDVYKGKLFNSYIGVQKKEDDFNMDNLYIYRTPTKKDQRKAILLNKVMDNLVLHEKILIQENNIKMLEEYKELFAANGINTVILNSKTRNEDEMAAEEYQSIINDSLLNNDIVLCTGVINAGVNINNKSVCSIIIQEKMQFDTERITQFLGRVREGQNTGIVFLTDGEKKPYRGSLARSFKYYNEMAELKRFERNEYYFNNFGLNVDINTIKKEWQFDKLHDGIRGIADCIYVDDRGLFQSDETMLYKRARSSYEQSNYHDNDFVLEMLAEVKAKNIKVEDIGAIKMSKDNKPKIAAAEEEKAADIMAKILDDPKAKNELYSYIKKNIKPKDFKTDLCNRLYNEFQGDRNYRDLIKDSRAILGQKEVWDKQEEVFTKILKAYAEIKKAKDRQEEIQSIGWVYIYNKRYELETDTSMSEDLMYTLIRKSCDCFVGTRHSIYDNKSISMDLLEEYIKAYNCTKKDNGIFDIMGNKLSVKKLGKEFIKLMKKIYISTDKMYLKSLR
jgi:superfamily II DNA/RNA helicase